MDINQIMQMIQSQGGQQGQGMGMPQGNPMMGQQPMQQQMSPQQMQQMALQQMWVKANSNGWIRGVPQDIFPHLPAPTKKELMQAKPPQILTIFQGLQKDATFIKAKNSNDIPGQRKRVEAYLKAFNLYAESPESIGDGQSA